MGRLLVSGDPALTQAGRHYRVATVIVYLGDFFGLWAAGRAAKRGGMHRVGRGPLALIIPKTLIIIRDC